MKTTVMRWEFFAPFDRKRLTGFKYERIIALGALIWELSTFWFVTNPCASKGSCCHVLTRLRLLTGEETAQRYQKRRIQSNPFSKCITNLDYHLKILKMFPFFEKKWEIACNYKNLSGSTLFRFKDTAISVVQPIVFESRGNSTNQKPEHPCDVFVRVWCSPCKQNNLLIV